MRFLQPPVELEQSDNESKADYIRTTSVDFQEETDYNDVSDWRVIWNFIVSKKYMTITVNKIKIEHKLYCILYKNKVKRSWGKLLRLSNTTFHAPYIFLFAYYIYVI